MILIVHSFRKELSRFSASVGEELVSLISKHSKWLTKSLLLLKKEGNIFVLKGYLGGKRVRVTVAKTAKGNYIPLEILKKESKGGYNIRDTYDAAVVIDRVNHEIAEGKYEIMEFRE